MTEAELTVAVLDTARTFGWRTAHFRPGQTKYGWRTAVQGDGKGFPDLVLIHADRGLLWFRELKVGKGVLSIEQAAWGHALTTAGFSWAVWRDVDWQDIVADLSAGKARAT